MALAPGEATVATVFPANRRLTNAGQPERGKRASQGFICVRCRARLREPSHGQIYVTGLESDTDAVGFLVRKRSWKGIVKPCRPLSSRCEPTSAVA